MKIPVELQEPRGLLLLTALVPLVLLYVLRVRRSKHVVSSGWLWSAAARDLLARSPFRRLVAQVPLFLQALAIIAASIALARPALRSAAVVGEHVAVVVDVSASMRAVDPARGVPRIALAREVAASVVDSLGPAGDAMIIEAGRDARVVCPLDRDTRRLGAAVAKLDARDVEGDLSAAVGLAVDRLRAVGGDRRVVIVTDGAVGELDLPTSTLPLDVRLVSAPVDNVGIVRVDVRSGTDASTKEEEVQAFALVASFAKAPREIFVTLRLAGVAEPLASRRFRIAPGERAPVLLTFKPADGDRGKGLVVEVSPHDAFATDDVAYARVPLGARQPVVLVGAAPSPWLERALLSDPNVELSKGSPAELDKSPVAAGTLHVFDRTCPSAPPQGDFVVVGPPVGTCLGVPVGAPIDRPAITSWANGDPRFRFLTLDGVHVAKATPLTVGNSRDALVRGTSDTLIADASTPGRTGTIVGFDVGESDWPLKASYVLFVRNTLELARAHRASGQVAPARAGEPLRVPVPKSATKVSVHVPGAKEPRALPVQAGLAVVPDTGLVGHYLVSWDGRDQASVLVPVNLTSERESDLHRRVKEDPKSGVTVTAAARPTLSLSDAGWVLALVALAFVVLDVLWLTRAPRARPGVTVAPRRKPA